jgi:acetyl esterase/lipase
MLSRLVSIAGLLVAVAAAAAAALIVVPAPSMNLALVSIAVGEKSYLVVAAGVLAAVLALVGSRPGLRGLATLTVLLSLAAIVMGLGPAAQALRLAGERRVDLDFGRYLRSRIDSTGPVKVEKTVPYATVDGRTLELDVYAPGHRSGGPAPVVLVVHGGGWSTGTKGEASLFSRRVADQGYAVFDIDYRMAPQPNWKAAVGDVKCAIGWVKEHAAAPEWNLDPRRITLLGRSAGAHLALIAAYTPGDPALPASCDAPDTTVESVVDLYGPTDLAWGYAHPLNPRVYDSRAREIGFIGGPPETHAALYRQLSPTERVTPGSPRTLLIHGGRDQIVAKQNSDLLGDKLHDAGVRYETLFIPYARHGFDFVFGGLSEQIVETVLLRFLDDRPKPALPTPPSD